MPAGPIRHSFGEASKREATGQNNFSPKKIKQNRAKKTWKEIVLKVFFWIFFLGFLVLTLWTIVFSQMVQVKNVEITGRFYGRQITDNDIGSIISGKYFSVIPRNNILFLSKSRISRSLRKQDETIKIVSIEKIFPDKIVVNITQRKTMLVWQKNGKRYLLDENGQAFHEIIPGEEMGEVVVVNDGSEGEIQIENNVVSPELVAFFHDLPDKVKEKTSHGIQGELYVPSKMSEEVQARTSEGWLVYFSLLEPLEYQTNVLKKILSENIPPEKLGDLEYIDLRLKGRAIYKIKQEEEQEEDKNDEEKKEEEGEKDKNNQDG